MLLRALIAAALLTACVDSALHSNGGSVGETGIRERSAADAVDDTSTQDGNSSVETNDVTRRDRAVDRDPTTSTDSIRSEPQVDPSRDDATIDSSPCAGLPACSDPGAPRTCDGTELVVCLLRDGCLFETRTNCSDLDQECLSSPEPRCEAPSVGGSGETCEDVMPVTEGVYRFETSAFRSDYADFDACGSLLNDSRGPDIVMSIVIDPGETLTATLESSDTDFDVVAAIADSCPDLTESCIAYSDESIFLYPEVVSATNNTAAAKLFYIIAAGDRADDFGPLTVTIDVR